MACPSEMRLRHLLLAVVVFLCLATSAAADPAVPGSALRLWIIGRAQLSFTVAITNPTDLPATFDGTGLYFVPVAKTEAPQRLGVVTPGHLASAPNAAEAWNGISVPAHATLQVTLTSYCLDVNRHGPGETTQYKLADARIPAALADSLSRTARSIATLGFDRDTKGPNDALPAPAVASSPVVNRLTQSAVWRIRGQMTTPLIGDTQ